MQVKRPGRSAKTISEANLDSAQEIALRDISADGKELTLVRRSYASDETKETLLRFAFPSGKRAK